MLTLRRHLRLWTLAWFVLQAASLSALAPRECCRSHRPAEAAEPCHEPPVPAPAAHCPMRGSDGTPCPMHRDMAPHDDQPPPSPASERCVLRGACAGQTVFAVLSYPGLGVAPMTLVALTATPHPAFGGEAAPLAIPSTPDPRPPRR